MKMIHRTMNRRAFAIAGFGMVFGARAARAQPATPASPTPATTALFRVDLPASSLPPAPVAIGAVGVMMTPGTSIVYPEGASGQSVAVDHVLAGDYEIVTGSALIHIDAAGNLTDIDAGAATGVAAGETIVLLQNQAAQQITAGDEETRTLTVGIFSVEQGTGGSEVEGTLEQKAYGGGFLETVPESGLTVTIVGVDQARTMTESLAQFPITLETGEEWVAVFLPMTG